MVCESINYVALAKHTLPVQGTLVKSMLSPQQTEQPKNPELRGMQLRETPYPVKVASRGACVGRDKKTLGLFFAPKIVKRTGLLADF